MLAIQRDPWRIDSLDSSLENGYPSSIHGGTGGGRFSPQPPIVLSAGGHSSQGRPGVRSGQGGLRQGQGIRPPGAGVSLDNQPQQQRGGRPQHHRDDQRHSRGISRDAREQGLGTLPHGVVYSNDAPKIYYPDSRTDGRTDGRTVYNDQNDGLGGAPYDHIVNSSSDNNNHQHPPQYQHGDGTYLGVEVRMGGPLNGDLNNHRNNNNNNGNEDLIITDYVNNNNMTSTGGVMNPDNLGDSEAMSVPADESPVLASRYRESTQGTSGVTGTSTDNRLPILSCLYGS